MYIKRDITKEVLEGSKDSPVIAIVGPRQSGKSTLCKEIFPKHAYVDMQDADTLDFALSDPKGFLQKRCNKYGIVIDEAQYAPKLFDQIKVEVDKDRSNMGRYILSGSQNFLLNEKITESLAGRVYIYTLLPFSIKELVDNDLLKHEYEEQILRGFYPGLYGTQTNVEKFYESYLFTYVERDLRQLRNIDNLALFNKFLKLCTTRIGQPLNMSSLAVETGISVQTVQAWLSILQASFIIFLLQPYHSNFSKRIVKSPKLYFYDVGLAAHIGKLSVEKLIEKQPVLGQFFENMIVVDLIKECINKGISYRPYFFRDVNQREVDLLIETRQKTYLIEIKLAAATSKKFFTTLNWLQEEFGIKDKTTLIYTGDQSQPRAKTTVLPWYEDYKTIKNR
ncbi:MAG TPA: ATP-binding protein [Candidatus Babeliales bacterium]|nr:ATP-binding protein [Candidatus Babeliales bacterium]